MLHVVVTVDRADAGILAHLGRVGDELVLVLAVVRVQEEHAADAAEGRAVLVVRFPVHAGAGAVAGVVDDFAVERPHFHADRQDVVRVVGILGRHDHVVIGHDQCRAVLRSGLQHDRFVVALGRVGQIVFVDQDHVTAGVGEDRRPAVTVDVVDRVLFDDLERVP